MSRLSLIRRIFGSVSEGSKGLDRNGRHVIHLAHDAGIPMYATLEKLSDTKLMSLAALLDVKVEELV